MTRSIPIEELGQAIRSQRGNRPLAEVGPEVGVSPSTLSRIERGQMPDLKTLKRLTAWLGVQVLTSDTTEDRVPTSEDVKRTVEVHLRAGRNISDDVARAVAESVEKIMEWELERHRRESG